MFNYLALFPLPIGAIFIQNIDEDTLDLVWNLCFQVLYVYLQKFTSDAQEGIGKVEDGKAVAHVLIPENFTDNYFQRCNNFFIVYVHLSLVV